MSILALRLICLAAALCWAVGVALIGFMPLRARGWAVGAALIVGIPLLGLATWRMGPLTGLAMLGAGAALLIWPPALILRRRRLGDNSPPPVAKEVLH